MSRRKLERFSENKSFSFFFQPTFEELQQGFLLKGKWQSLFFKNNYPIILELGCGKGEYTTGLAEKFPQKNFIGIDVKGSRMWVGAKHAQINQIQNVAFVRTHISHINTVFDSNEIDEIWITFPDPFLRESKERKRLTSPDFLQNYLKILKPEGRIHLKTDSHELYTYTLKVVETLGYKIVHNTENLYASEIDNEAVWLKTYYESIWLNDGLTIKYLSFIPATNLSRESEMSFFDKVKEVTQRIPYGKVTTYGAIARYLGCAGSARMVGWALNSCKTSVPLIPAHRVVNKNGLMTGKFHFEGNETMRILLESEGIQVVENKIVNFNDIFWVPE